MSFLISKRRKDRQHKFWPSMSSSTQCQDSNSDSSFSHSYATHQHVFVSPPKYIQKFLLSHHFHCENLYANYHFLHMILTSSHNAFTPLYSIFLTTDHLKTMCVTSTIPPVLFHCRQYNAVLFIMISLTTADIFLQLRGCIVLIITQSPTVALSR